MEFGHNILTVGVSGARVSLFCHIVNLRQGGDHHETTGETWSSWAREGAQLIIIVNCHYTHIQPLTVWSSLWNISLFPRAIDTRKCVVRTNIAFPPQVLPLLKWNVVILSKINLGSVSFNRKFKWKSIIWAVKLEVTKIFSVLRCQLLPGPGRGLASKLHVVHSGECEERDHGHQTGYLF